MKRKLETKYPYAAKEDEYIKELLEEYHSIHPSLTAQQIEGSIVKVVGLIDWEIKEYESIKGKLSNINMMKNIPYLEGEPEVMETLVYFYQKEEEIIRHYLGKMRQIPMPDLEHMPEYLEFISKMTIRVIDDICKATELKIPQEEKDAYQDWLEKIHNISSQEIPQIKKPIYISDEDYDSPFFSETESRDEESLPIEKDKAEDINETIDSDNESTESTYSECSYVNYMNADVENEKKKTSTSNAKTASVAQNDNLSLETNYNSDIYNYALDNDLLSQLHEQTPNIISLELKSKLDTLEVENEEKQETENAMAEIELNQENMQVKVSMSEYANLVNETIWDHDVLDYLNHLNSIYKPESVDNIVSLPIHSIIISDLIPKIDPIAFLGEFSLGQKNDAGGDMLNLGFIEGIFL